MKTNVLIYNSLIVSHINYGLLIWGFACEQIAKLQKKAIRIMSVSKYNDHTEPIFKQLHLLKITYTLIVRAKFYYKLRNRQCVYG